MAELEGNRRRQASEQTGQAEESPEANMLAAISDC
jgi:hypothetical protein